MTTDLDEMARHANALSEHYRAEVERLRAENEQLRQRIKTLDLDMGVLVSIINDRKPTPKTATL